MNIFVLDEDPVLAAEYHCDKHVIKMILESAQMLSTAIQVNNKVETRYKATHVNHPCSIWVRTNGVDYRWLYELARELNRQYRLRYDKTVNHKSYDAILELPDLITDRIAVATTPFVKAMPVCYSYNQTAVQAYRRYYYGAKRHIATWRNGEPGWFTAMKQSGYNPL